MEHFVKVEKWNMDHFVKGEKWNMEHFVKVEKWNMEYFVKGISGTWNTLLRGEVEHGPLC